MTTGYDIAVKQLAIVTVTHYTYLSVIQMTNISCILFENMIIIV